MKTSLMLVIGFSFVWLSTADAKQGRNLAAPPLLTTRPKIETEVPRRKTGSLAVGLELGTVGITDNANNDVFGLRLLYGGRASMSVPLNPHFSFRPGLGYFRRNEGSDEGGVLTHLIEASAGVQWSPWPEYEFRPVFGLQARADFYMGQTYTLSSSVVSPTLLRLRLGPTLAAALNVDKQLVLFLETEGGIRTHEPVRGYGALSFGFSYSLY
jgi:hypothetical protein